MYNVLQLNRDKVLSYIPSLTPKSSKLLLLLSALADEEDLVEVHPHLLAKKFSLTKQTVVSGLNELRKLGLVRTMSPSKNGLGHIYRLSVNDDGIESDIMERLF